jgi:hypothetical protein
LGFIKTGNTSNIIGFDDAAQKPDFVYRGTKKYFLSGVSISNSQEKGS